MLIESGARLEPREGEDHWTTYYSYGRLVGIMTALEALELLISVGADINTKVDDYSRTLLEIAAARGSTGAIGFLLDKGVPMKHSQSLYDTEEVLSTPLHEVARSVRDVAVKLLLERGLWQIWRRGRRAILLYYTL